jgi:hypothetical protein
LVSRLSSDSVEPAQRPPFRQQKRINRSGKVSSIESVENVSQLNIAEIDTLPLRESANYQLKDAWLCHVISLSYSGSSQCQQSRAPGDACGVPATPWLVLLKPEPAEGAPNWGIRVRVPHCHTLAIERSYSAIGAGAGSRLPAGSSLCVLVTAVELLAIPGQFVEAANTPGS